MDDNAIKAIINTPMSNSDMLIIYINKASNKPYVSLGKCTIPQLKPQVKNVEGIVLKDLQTHENFAFTKEFINERFERAKKFAFSS